MAFSNLYSILVEENRKSKFLSRYIDTDDYELYRSIINTIGVYEDLFGRDLLFFTKSMMIAFTETECKRPERFAEFTRFINDYYKFYNRKPPTIEAIHFITDKIRQRVVSDESELQFILDSIFLPDEAYTLDVMRKACLILLFYGVSKNEIPLVKKKQISDDQPFIMYPDGGVFRDNIPSSFMDTLRQCKSMKFVISTNQQYTSDESRRRQLQESDCLIRAEATFSKTETVSTTFIDKIFVRSNFKFVNKDLNSSRLIESGFYSWIKARKGESFGGAFSDFKVLYEEYFGKLTSRCKIYYDNYQIWKTLT